MFPQRLLPVVVLEEVSWALPLADALLAGGLDIVEVTLRTPAAAAGIAAVRARHPAMRLGAGTVLDAAQVPRLKDLGVDFAVSPGLNPRVAEAAAAAGLPLFPGVANPTDIEAARALGFSVLKFFPAEPLGGARMLQALIGPYGQAGVRFVPTGGVNLANAPSYAALPEVAAVGGSWFVAAKTMRAGRWDEIERQTREAVAVMAAGAAG